jgi:photosystem II cytochrome c550
MLKRLIFGIIATVFFALQLHIDNASALNVDEALRTVKLNSAGEQLVLSNEELTLGERLFYDTCSQCHNSGRTKSNPNVTLNGTDLANAYPARDNVEAIVDYLVNPTTYDGEEFIYEIHPNTTRADLFAEMRNYSQEDLEAVSGFVLSAEKIKASWGRGKVYD